MEALAQLIDGSFLQSGARWALNTIPGFPPIIQTVHILGIAVVMATVVLLNLRVLGVVLPSQDLGDMTRRVMPWFWIILAANVISGAFFVFARPNRYFYNPVFTWKMGFLLVAVALILLFYLMHRRRPGYWSEAGHKWLARGLALATLALLVLVMLAGRWIAYLEYLQYPLWTMEAYDAGPQESLWLTLENWPLSQVIAATNWFPLIESIHVIALTLVLGTILWVDLRLLGLGLLPLRVSVLNRELIPWTWGAFVVAFLTGVAMFITRASGHMENPAFLWKLVLLALAGANMAYFHFRLYKQIDRRDAAVPPPAALKLAGGLSLLFWSGVTLAGRWVGHIV